MKTSTLLQMRRLLIVLLCLLAMPCLAAVHVYFPLSGFNANPSSNRWVTLQPSTPFPGNIYNYTSSIAGGFWVSNFWVGDTIGVIKQKGTASEIRFQVTVSSDDSGELYATNITSVIGVQTYPSTGRAAYSIDAANARFARVGSGGLSFVPQYGSGNLTNWSSLSTNVLGSSGGGGYFLASSNVTPSTVSGSNVFTVTGTVPSATANAFSEAYTAWVSKSGDDSTGTVGKQALPFLTVSNAVQAVKLALGSSSSGGLVFISPGVYGETWINLQRTNKTGISLFGQGDVWLTATSSGLLTTYGPLVTVGHSSKVMGLNISNNISASVKQAAIGWDTSKSASLGTTLVCATNVYINVPIGLGSSDVGYFYDSSASGDGEVTVDGCNWQSKWDCFFLSTTSFEISTTIRNSSLTVNQPSNYDFPGGGSGSGRARAAFIGDGHLTVHNSRILALSSTAASNETSGLTFNGTLYDWTNINSSFQAQGTTGTIKDINDQGLRQDYGRISPQSLATNAPAAGKTLQATSPFSSAWVTASGSGDVTQSGQNNFSGSNYFGGLSRFAGPVGLSNTTIINNSTWSVNNLIWSYSTGKEIWNYGNINVTNNPTTTFDWWDVNAGEIIMQIEPDLLAGDPHVYLLNPKGNGAGFTNIPAAQLTGTIAADRLGTGSALQVVRRNAGNTALEFFTLSGGDALTSNPLSQFAATTSAQLAGVLSDEQGSGVVPFVQGPVLTNGNTFASTLYGALTLKSVTETNLQILVTGGTDDITIKSWGNGTLSIDSVSDGFSNPITITNGDIYAGKFTGSGLGLTAIPAAQLTGTLPQSVFPNITSLTVTNIYTLLTNKLLSTDSNGKIVGVWNAPTNSAASNNIIRWTSGTTTEFTTPASGGGVPTPPLWATNGNATTPSLITYDGGGLYSGFFGASGGIGRYVGLVSDGSAKFYIAANYILAGPSYQYAWQSSLSAGAGPDTGLARNAAGVAEVNNGTAGQFGGLMANSVTATNLVLRHTAAPTLPPAGGVSLWASNSYLYFIHNVAGTYTTNFTSAP